jgi:FixJ family two-component response regulator
MPLQKFLCAEDVLKVCTPGALGCIILDVNMPDMDGPTLQEKLQISAADYRSSCFRGMEAFRLRCAPSRQAR